MNDFVFVDGSDNYPGCRCGDECSMPCWQRIGVAPACERCGARISAYAEAGSVLCSPCGGTKYPTHLAMIDALAHARGERPTVCKRGHDLDIHGTKSKRTGGRITIVCGECKRQRDAGYAKARRKRQAAPGYLTNCDPGDEQP